MRIVYTSGSFDVALHSGHLNLLMGCKKIGDKVVVSLNTDEFIETYKGAKPILSYEERASMLSACKYVDQVIPNSGGADSKPAILSVRPQFIVVGSDWAQKDRDYMKQMSFDRAWLDKQGITLIFLSYTEGISTTEIKRRIIELK